MMYLGWDFVISSLLWLTAIGLFLYFFRKQIFRFFYGATGFSDFISQLKIYLEKNYPGIKFDYAIIELSKSEQNPQSRKYLIVDDIISQYMKLKLDSSKYPQATPKELHWGSYVFESEPNRDKLPKDWMKRKNALLLRDNHRCFRCTKPLTINTVDIHMIRSLKEGGKYFLENLIPVCKDCEKVLSKDSKKLNHLDIKEDLYDIVKSHL